jgi:hypothetical protein
MSLAICALCNKFSSRILQKNVESPLPPPPPAHHSHSHREGFRLEKNTQDLRIAKNVQKCGRAADACICYAELQIL